MAFLSRVRRNPQRVHVFAIRSWEEAKTWIRLWVPEDWVEKYYSKIQIHLSDKRCSQGENGALGFEIQQPGRTRKMAVRLGMG